MFGFPVPIKVEPLSFYNCPPTHDTHNDTSNTPSTTDEENPMPSHVGLGEMGSGLNLTSGLGLNSGLSNGSSHDNGISTPKPDNVARSKPQGCKVCGKVLSSASSYYVHMKLHSGSKPFKCTACEASFVRKPYLEVHLRTHTGEKPFQCQLCEKRFTQKSSLNTHKRVHSGVKPYACDICSKRFAVKSYVTAHRWSHVAEKPLTCDRCNLSFTSKNQFSIHLRTHTSAHFECHICGRAFARDSFLIRHHNRVHRDAIQHYQPPCDMRYVRNPSPADSHSLS